MLGAKVEKADVTKVCALKALKTIEIEIDLEVQNEHEKWRSWFWLWQSGGGFIEMATLA